MAKNKILTYMGTKKFRTILFNIGAIGTFLFIGTASFRLFGLHSYSFGSIWTEYKWFVLTLGVVAVVLFFFNVMSRKLPFHQKIQWIWLGFFIFFTFQMYSFENTKMAESDSVLVTEENRDSITKAELTKKDDLSDQQKWEANNAQEDSLANKKDTIAKGERFSVYIHSKLYPVAEYVLMYAREYKQAQQTAIANAKMQEYKDSLKRDYIKHNDSATNAIAAEKTRINDSLTKQELLNQHMANIRQLDSMKNAAIDQLRAKPAQETIALDPSKKDEQAQSEKPSSKKGPKNSVVQVPSNKGGSTVSKFVKTNPKVIGKLVVPRPG